MSMYGIKFLKEVRAMIKSIRSDLVLVVNACAMSGYAYWKVSLSQTPTSER